MTIPTVQTVLALKGASLTMLFQVVHLRFLSVCSIAFLIHLNLLLSSRLCALGSVILLLKLDPLLP